MRTRELTRWSVLIVLAAALLAPARTQAQKETATQFYQKYLAAFAKAKTVDEIIPFMAAENRKQVEATPKEDRVQMFGMIKALSHHDVKVLKEEVTPDGKTVLTVEGVDDDKAKGTGKVTIVKENGAWKLGEESWSSKVS